VPGARIYDLVSGLRTPIQARSSIAASEAGQMAAPDYVSMLFKNCLHLAGRPQMSTRPSVMGPMMSSLPSERLVAELMLLSVVNAWPPHHAVRGSGEPI
jgi:hypothetical protein